MEVLFITFLVLSVYPYLIYPAAVFVVSRFFFHPWEKGDNLPQVTLFVSAYNEENVIEKKVKNALSLDYPEGLLEVIVISDGSSDRTNEIVSKFNDARLVLKAFPGRSGKTACLQQVVPEAKGEIILFTDANSLFPSDLLSRLVRNFGDPDVGLVTGWTQYRTPQGGSESSGMYCRLEKWTKYRESLVASCVGADGAIFAIRKELIKPLQPDDINDFIIPLHVIEQGRRVVLDPEVFCIEPPAVGSGKEFRRQLRITSRTLKAIFGNARFLNPFRFGYYSISLLSHKLLRFLVPFFMLGAFITNLILVTTSNLYVLIFIGQVLFFSLGLLGLIGMHSLGPAGFIKEFLVAISAQFLAWLKILFSKPDIMWTPER